MSGINRNITFCQKLLDTHEGKIKENHANSENKNIQQNIFQFRWKCSDATTEEKNSYNRKSVKIFKF
jgi:hypothetical protein